MCEISDLNSEVNVGSQVGD